MADSGIASVNGSGGSGSAPAIPGNISAFLPKEALNNRRTPTPAKPWNAYLDWLVTFIDNEDRSAEISRMSKWRRNDAFYQGRQNGYYSSTKGTWVDVNPTEDTIGKPTNLLRYFIDSLIKEWMRSRTELCVGPRSEKMEAQGAARVAKAVVENIQNRTWNVFDTEREGKNSVLFGNSFRESYWSAENSDEMVEIPIYEDREVAPSAEGYECADCGSTGPVAQVTAGTCPQCGSQNVQSMQTPPVTAPVMTGTQKMKAGQVVCKVRDPFEIKGHLHARRMEFSPYLRHSQYILRSVLETIYPWAQISARTGDSKNTGLYMQRQAERSPGNMGGQQAFERLGDENNADQLIEYRRYWVRPALYANYEFPVDTEMADGSVIPAGTKLTDIFPEGFRITRINSFTVDVREENFVDHWVHIVWNPVPTRLFADGAADDAVETQDQLNKTKSLTFENQMKNAAPPIFYNQLKYSRSSMVSRPGWAVPMRQTALGSDKPGDYVFIPPARSLGAEIHNIMNEQKQDLSMLVGGTFGPQGGDPNIDTKTATGLALLREQAVSMISPRLYLKGQGDVQMAHQWLRLIKENHVGKTFLTNLSDYAEVEGQWFEAADIEEDFEITALPESTTPKSPLEARNDLIEASTFAGLPLGIFNPALPPHLRKLAAERFRVPFNADELSADERKQKIEIEKIKSICQMVQQQGMPDDMALMLVEQNVIAQVVIDNHEVHIAFLQRYLKTDEGMQLAEQAPVIVKALLQHLNDHILAASQKEMTMAMAMAPAQAMSAGASGGGAPPETGAPPAGKSGEGGASKSKSQPGTVGPGKQRVSPVTAAHPEVS